MSAPRFKSLGGAVLFALLAVSATAAVGGTVSHGNFNGTKADFYNVTESGQDIPPSLFVPKTPTVTNSPNDQLNFFPEQFIQTDQNVTFDLKQKSSLLSIGVRGKQAVGDPGILGYALTGASFNIAGTYTLNAPFGAGDFLPIYAGASRAKVTSGASLTAQVTGVNFQPYSGGSSLPASIVITADNVTDLTGPGYVQGNWSGFLELDWNALRAAANVGSKDAITDVQFQITASIGAASIYGRSEISLTNFNVNDPTAPVPVPVPEPPTIVLAGLGAMAVVVSGVRRKLRIRRNADSDSSGAIALTA